MLFREGEPFEEFLVILSGTVDVVHDHGSPDARTVAVHGPGRFLGELGLLEGQAAFNTAIVREPGEILAVPVERGDRDLAQGLQSGHELALRTPARPPCRTRPKPAADGTIGLSWLIA